MNPKRTINTPNTRTQFLSDEPPLPNIDDSFLDIARKLIAQEILFVYVNGYALIRTFNPKHSEFFLWFLLITCFIFTYLYSRFKLKVGLRSQEILSAIVFIPWALTIGSAIDLYTTDSKFYGVFFLLFCSLVPPFFYLKDNKDKMKYITNE